MFSVLNCADYIYGITDYRKVDGQFVCALCDHSMIKMLLNYPEMLSSIMAISERVLLKKPIYDELTSLSYKTTKVGPSADIDHQMENVIQEKTYLL